MGSLPDQNVLHQITMDLVVLHEGVRASNECLPKMKNYVRKMSKLKRFRTLVN
jgi:hypothetical protein